MNCLHHSKRGDNYGVTCNDCGIQLEGYGEWAEGNGHCIHNFLPMLDEQYEECVYCGIQQERSEE